MKKGIFKILFCTFLLFSCFMNVLADDDENLRRYVDDGVAILVCEYVDSESNIQNRIYYHFRGIGNTYQIGPWAYVYRQNERLYYLESFFLHNNRSLGQFFEVFGSGSITSYNLHNNRMPNDFENSFTCPAYAHADLTRQHEVCYSDDPTCGKNFEYGPFKLNTEAKTIFNLIDDFSLEYATSSYEFVDTWIYGGDITAQVREKTMQYIKGKYRFGTAYEMPKFIENYINTLTVFEPGKNEKQDKAVEAAHERADSVLQQRVELGQLTEEEGEKLRKELKERDLSDIMAYSVKGSYNLNLNNDRDGCHSILGSDMSKIVKNLFTFVQYLGPVLIAVFSIMDFVKASVAGDEGQLKKAGERLGKRIVCGILLFFVPLICSILLDFGGITLPETCIQQYGSKETTE